MMQPPADPVEDAMLADAPAGETQSTQQETQPASQFDNNLDAHLWGYLIPCSSRLLRIDFQKVRSTYTIGRNSDVNTGNDIVLPGKKISNFHCKIHWDGQEDRQSAITVTDLSSNGTFINGTKIGKNRSMLLYEGNEIAFGTPQPQVQDNGIEDYRFVYRHMAAGTPTTGLHAHYQMHGELGKGSYATVMKAMHRDSAKWYAIKVMQRNRLRTVTGNTAAGENGFAREINILETLQHPNICQLKEVFYEEHTVNLVLEYIEGGDLLDYIVKREGLREPEAQYLTYQICDALAYIHSKNIAHRDLKPENVLLTNDSPPKVKVADFGLAKAVDTLTMLRTMCGTPCYLAPEVVLQVNNQGYDNVVDSWSVGVIVFSMLTGNNAFIEDTGLSMEERVQTRVVDWETLRNSASRNAEDFIRRLLEFDPRDRMTPSAAREHPWLSSIHATAPQHTRDRTASPDPEPVPLDASMASLHSNGMTLDASAADAADASMDDDGAEPAQIRGHRSVTGSQPGDIPGAFPHSQPITRQSSRLQRRRDVILSQQEEDEMVMESDDESPPSPPNPPTATTSTRRRSPKIDYDYLSPLEEEDPEDRFDEERERANRLRKPVGRVQRPRPSKAIAEGPAARMRRLRDERAQRKEEATGITPPVRRSSRLSTSPMKAPRRG